MKVLIHKVFPKIYNLKIEDNSLKILYDVKDLYIVDEEIDSLELINKFRRLGRKIFTSLFNNDIQILILGSNFDMTCYSHDIFTNYHLYEEDICKFIEENGLHFFSKEQLENYEECIISQDSCIDFKILGPLITSAITIYLLETLRTNTDKGRLPKIYKMLNTKESDKISKHLDNLFYQYGTYENNDLITIDYTSHKEVSYNRKIISLLNGVWNEYYTLIYSNFSSVKTCIYCGEYITYEKDMKHTNLHKQCLNELRNKYILEIDKKLLKKLSKEEVLNLEKKKKLYLKYDDEVYQRFKKRCCDKKYYDKKKIKS